MGLLDRAPVRESGQPCLLGRVVTGERPNGDGEFLDDSDVDELIRRRAAGHGPSRLFSVLFGAGFDIGETAIARHVAGRCKCPPDTPLYNQKIGTVDEPHS